MALSPAQLQTLKAEVFGASADPRGYGYAPFVQAGADNAVATLLDFVRDGTTPCPLNNVAGPAISLNRGTITSQELVEAVVQSEMPSNASQRDWLIMVASGDRVRVDNGSSARTGLLAIFGAATTTRANLTAAAVRAGSRAEELFGLNVAVTADDVSAARVA